VDAIIANGRHAGADSATAARLTGVRETSSPQRSSGAFAPDDHGAGNLDRDAAGVHRDTGACGRRCSELNVKEQTRLGQGSQIQFLPVNQRADSPSAPALDPCSML
jgi:hypothetical protein